MPAIVIVSALRTPMGRLGGAFSSLPAHRLGQAVIAETLRRADVAPGDVSEVIMGQVLTAGAGQNPARQAAMAAGLPAEVPAYGVNQVCGSGLRAVILGCQSLLLGDSSIVLAGGQESMSQAPHVANLRKGAKLGDVSLIDSMVHDGLRDAFHDYHMGITAENVAREFKINREEQDDFALRSQQKAAQALQAGTFTDEIVSVEISRGKKVEKVTLDEAPRPETDA